MRLLHAPISATEYVSRQQKRPVSAPPTGSVLATARRAAISGDAVAPAWRRAHFVASARGDGACEPPKAMAWAEVKLRQKHGGRVLGDATGVYRHSANARDGVGQSTSRSGGGARPATARAAVKENKHRNDGGGDGTSRGAGRERPGSARPSSPSARAPPPTPARARTRAGTGRGGGQMPVDEDLVAVLTAAAARRGTGPKAVPARKSALSAIACSLGGGGGEDQARGIEGSRPGGAGTGAEAGANSGLNVQEMIPLTGHLERMRKMARELDPKQQLWVARSMAKVREDINEALMS